MAVVEYMFVVNQHGKLEVPGFISDRGHWLNSANHTYVGWVSDTREFYVPDTIVTLTKEEFVARLIAIHGVNAYTTMGETPAADPVAMTDAEVTAMAETWYDDFVAKNS